MILRRFAFLTALVCAALFTQFPEFVEQYRQRLGGAIDELAAVLARFDRECAEQGLSEGAGIERLRANPDLLARQRGLALQDDAGRLQRLRDAQASFRSQPPVARLATFVTSFDERIARGTLADFEPAIPTSLEGFVLGGIGFLSGECLVLLVGLPLRGRLRAVRAA